MNIWLVSIFENTPLDDNLNTRYNSIARTAVENGHKVTFWASTFKHNVKKQRYSKTIEKKISVDLKVVFVESDSYSENISLKRLISHYKFSGSLEQEFNDADEKPDVILLAYPPVKLASKITSWGKKNGVPVIVDIIDPWPEVFKFHLNYPKWILDLVTYPIARNAQKAMGNALGIIGISEEYINWGESLSSSPKSTRCFYPAIDLKVSRNQLKEVEEMSSKEEDCFSIIYAGSLGYSYDLPTILKAAEILEEQVGNAVRFTIAGDGPYRKLVEEYEKEHQNLNYIGRVPKEELMKEYHQSDMGMTQHTEGATQSVTYKLFDLLGAGLPIFNSLESEMKSIIVDNNVGLHNAPGDVDKLVENILYCYNNRDEVEVMRRNGVQLTQKRGDSQVVYANMLSFIKEIADNNQKS